MSREDTLDLLGDVQPPLVRRAKFESRAGYKIVSVRLRTGEFESFRREVETRGMTPNMALRIAARRITGFIEIDEQTRRILQHISDEIGIISRDINKLARSAAGSRPLDLEALGYERQEFGKQFMALDNQLRLLLNVSRRRKDGKMLLRDAEDETFPAKARRDG